ncbi:MAG: OmpA family protein [Minicystis sp.]
MNRTLAAGFTVIALLDGAGCAATSSSASTVSRRPSSVAVEPKSEAAASSLQIWAKITLVSGDNGGFHYRVELGPPPQEVEVEIRTVGLRSSVARVVDRFRLDPADGATITRGTLAEVCMESDPDGHQVFVSARPVGVGAGVAAAHVDLASDVVVTRSIVVLSGFAFASAKVPPVLARELEVLGAELRASGGRYVVNIVGHADRTAVPAGRRKAAADSAENVRYSAERADAVAAALVAGGARRGAIRTKGVGATRPLADIDDLDERQRRVEVEVTYNPCAVTGLRKSAAR